MTGPKKPRGLKRLEELVHNLKFVEEIERIKQQPLHARPIYVSQLLSDFKLPSNYSQFILHFVEVGKFDMSKIGPLVQVISEHDKTVEPSNDPKESWRIYKSLDTKGVYLTLNYDVTQPELIKFVRTHWSDLIVPRLERLGDNTGKRPRLSSIRNPKKDREVYVAYMNRKENKKRVSEIAIEFGIDISHLYRIVNRQKRLQ